MAKLGKEFRYAKPREGLLVRYPKTMVAMPKDGAVIPWIGPDGRFWRRRLKCGDIEIISKPKEESAEEIKEVIKRKYVKSGEGGINGN